jgi:hypothetical protein
MKRCWTTFGCDKSRGKTGDGTIQSKTLIDSNDAVENNVFHQIINGKRVDRMSLPLAAITLPN